MTNDVNSNEFFSYTKIMCTMEGTSTIRNVKKPQKKSGDRTNSRPKQLLKRPIFFPFTIFALDSPLQQFMIDGGSRILGKSSSLVLLAILSILIVNTN